MPQADIQAVRKAHRGFCDAMNGQQATQLASFFALDGALLWPGLPTVKGRQAIQAWFEALYKDYIARIEVSGEEYLDAGEFIIESGLFKFTLTPKAGGEPTVDDGKWLAVWHRDADGTWRVLKDMSNSNLPPSAATS